jgi:hypothetical protein
MHDLLRNGPSYSLLWPEHTTQFPRNPAQSHFTGIVMRHFYITVHLFPLTILGKQ